MAKFMLLSQDVCVGHCFDAVAVIEDLITGGHMSGHDPNCQEIYHLAQFEPFEIIEIECEGNSIIFYSSYFPSIVVPINFLMEVESVH